MTSTDLPWTEQESLDLFMHIIERRTGAIAEWMNEHVVDARTEYTVISAIAQWLGVLAGSLETRADFWAVAGMKSDAPAWVVGGSELISAGVNNDLPAIDGHMDALFERSMEERMLVLHLLTQAVAQLGDELKNQVVAKAGDNA